MKDSRSCLATAYTQKSSLRSSSYKSQHGACLLNEGKTKNAGYGLSSMATCFLRTNGRVLDLSPRECGIGQDPGQQPSWEPQTPLPTPRNDRDSAEANHEVKKIRPSQSVEPKIEGRSELSPVDKVLMGFFRNPCKPKSASQVAKIIAEMRRIAFVWKISRVSDDSFKSRK
jgi:hypothetical protein